MHQPTTKMLVIRHGETVWNAQARIQGHGDSPLTETGRRQARLLGQRLAHLDFDRLICSDLGRTMETASLIAVCTGHEIQTDPRLRERHYGVLEGMTVDDVKHQFPESYDRLMAGDPEYVVPQGESHGHLYKRNIDFFKEYITAHPGTTAALVVHGGVMDSIFRFVARLPLDQPMCFVTANTSLSTISHGIYYGTLRWVIETWGDVSHLN